MSIPIGDRRQFHRALKEAKSAFSDHGVFSVLLMVDYDLKPVIAGYGSRRTDTLHTLADLRVRYICDKDARERGVCYLVPGEERRHGNRYS